MALNVKAAMVLCMGFIGAMSWVANQVELPRIEVASPLSAGTPVDFARALGPAAAWADGDVDRRATWARGFERPNAMDVQTETNRAASATLAVWSPSEPLHAALPSAVLPPLVGIEPPEVPVVAAAPDSAEELPGTRVELVAETQVPADVAAGAPRRAVRSYRVARGDTLTGIARRHWNSDDQRLVAVLVSANPQLADRKHGRILVGEELRIPDSAATPGTLTVPPETPAVAAPGTSGEQWYTIRRNDTLADIAQRFLNDPGRWREIADLNGKLNPHKIVPGTRIKLPPIIRLARG